MPFTVPNSGDATYAAQAAPDSGDLAIITAASGLTGVISGCTASVTGSDRNVTIAAGVVVVAGKEVAVASGALAIDAYLANPRFDLITVNSSGTKAVTKGTAGANPVFPAIPASSVVLHAVYVANVASIASTALVDKRVMIVRDTDAMAYIYL